MPNRTDTAARPSSEARLATSGPIAAPSASQAVEKRHKLRLYTPEQRRRRDETRWTLVQGVLAPLQFVVFLVSLGLIMRFLATGEGEGVATASIIAKTLILYTIMITGAIWEKVVFGQYLFARSFFWEDVFSMLVLALHTAYLAALLLDLGGDVAKMQIALAAYAAYVINAGQFIWKLRMARLEGVADLDGDSATGATA